MRQRSVLVLFLASSLLAAACSDDPIYPFYFADAVGDGSGGGSDAGTDASDDAGDDTGTDVGDTGRDTGPSCEPGATRCHSGGVESCVDGSWTVTACDEGTECLVEGGVASCVATACEPFSRGCFDDATAWQCDEDGSARSAIPCATGASCVDGSCVQATECLNVTPTVLEFGEVVLGTDATRTVQLWSCGSEPVEIVLVETTEDAFRAAAPTTPFLVDGTVAVDVVFEPLEPGEAFGELYLETAGGDLYAVDLNGFAPSAECPVARGGCRNAHSGGSYGTTITVPVGAEVECSDTGSTGPEEIVDWFWGMEALPFGSGADIVNDGDFAYFQADLAGLYTVTLGVGDDEGTRSCNTQRINVTATPGDSVMPSLHVQLTWDDGADLDNHLLRGTATRGSNPGDCHYANMTPDWGAFGPLNDPRLDVDDTDGFGPENINIDVVEAGIDYTALAFVTSLADESTRATLRISVGGAVVRELTKTLTARRQVWTAVKLRFAPDGTHTLTVVDTLGVAP